MEDLQWHGKAWSKSLGRRHIWSVLPADTIFSVNLELQAEKVTDEAHGWMRTLSSCSDHPFHRPDPKQSKLATSSELKVGFWIRTNTEFWSFPWQPFNGTILGEGFFPSFLCCCSLSSSFIFFLFFLFLFFWDLQNICCCWCFGLKLLTPNFFFFWNRWTWHCWCFSVCFSSVVYFSPLKIKFHHNKHIHVKLLPFLIKAALSDKKMFHHFFFH